MLLLVSAFLLCIVVKSQDLQDLQVSYRLSNTTEPVAYELWLETKIHDKIFDYAGKVKIALKALEASDIIMIHSDDLTIHNYTLHDLMNNNLKITDFEMQKNRGIVMFHVEERLRIDEIYILDIDFTGFLKRIPNGFCYSTYVDEHGDINYIATSHMHISNARKAFPCYDEPRYRTPFTIHISHHPSYRAISNVPALQVINNSADSVTTTFERTLPTSVNTLAFSITNHAEKTRFFDSLNLNISIFVARQHLDEVDYALDFMGFLLEKLRNFLDMDIQLPKLDAIIINDLLVTGLENWGLIFFNPVNLLYRENITNPSQKMSIVRTISHQLVHYYFGNIVGITWWNLFWLTEGFATYFEYYFSNQYLEEFPVTDIFCMDFMQKFFVEHSYLLSNSLNKYIETPNEVFSIFSFAMMSRASSTVRMIDHFLGRQTFQKGLQKYVKEMKYLVAESEDLCRGLQEAVDENQALPEGMQVEDIINSWINQPGYPLLTVMRNYQSNEIVVNQQRFLSSRYEVDQEGLSWYIPLSISTASTPDTENTKPWAWLNGGSREIILRTMGNKSWTSEDWVLFNVQQTGYYRVNYDTQNWKLLANELNQGPPFAIGSVNRAQIIDDSFNLAYSDVIPFTLALDIIKFMKFEQDYGVWISANRHLLSLSRHLEGPSYELYFGKFLQHLTEDHFDKLDVFENINGKDTIKNTFLRPIIVDLACRSGLGVCLTATRIMVTAEALTGYVLAPHEKPSIYYCHGLKNADVRTFKYFWNKMKSITNEQERSHIANSIGCYHDFDSVYELLLEIGTPSLLDLYTDLERYQIISYAIRHGNSRVVLEFLKNNHEDIAKTFTFNPRMDQALKEITENILEEDVSLFQDVIDILFNAGHISVSQVDRIRIELDYHHTWLTENKITIEEWIREYFEPVHANAVDPINSLAVIIFSIAIQVIANIP